MKAIIIEDETTAVNSLKAVLAQNTVTQIEVIAELESIEESVDFFRTSPHPDVIFMDIHLLILFQGACPLIFIRHQP